jgi:hypothetical protein
MKKVQLPNEGKAPRILSQIAKLTEQVSYKLRLPLTPSEKGQSIQGIGNWVVHREDVKRKITTSAPGIKPSSTIKKWGDSTLLA